MINIRIPVILNVMPCVLPVLLLKIMIEIFILSIIQGVSEFLPISSSSHLILADKYFNFDNQSLSLDVSLHIGSFIAVIFYFRKEISIF